MKKQLLAAVISSVVAGQAMAITVVDNGTSTFVVGGYADVRYNVDAGEDTDKVDGSGTRINFAFDHKLNEELTAFAKAEWGFDAVKDSGSPFDHRLGYVGVEHETAGRVVFGREWSSYGLVAGYTDQFAAAPHGGAASGYYGEDGTNVGTSRATDVLQYSNSFNGLDISVQTQLGDRALDEDVNNFVRKQAYGAAISYALPYGIQAGVGYNWADIADTTTPANDHKRKSLVFGVNYTADYGLYTAFTYSMLDNYNDDKLGCMTEATGYEFYIGQKLPGSLNNFKVETGFISLEGDDKDGKAIPAEIKSLPVAVVYDYKQIRLSATYQFAMGETIDTKNNNKVVETDDTFVVQARYYF